MDRRAQNSTSSPRSSSGDRNSSTNHSRTRRPDPARLHPETAQITRVERSLYQVPLSEKKAIVQKLMEIHRHNIGALAHASTQPGNKVDMLLEADVYLRLKDKAHRDKFKDDVTLLQEMREKTMAQILELEKTMDRLEGEIRLVERPRQLCEQDQAGQLRDLNQSHSSRQQNPPRQLRDQNQNRSSRESNQSGQSRDQNQARQALDQNQPSWGQKRTRTTENPR